jgi:lysine-specific demethylase 3
MNINGLNDSHKRTSISQLLNPASRESSSFAPDQHNNLPSIGSAQPHHDQQGSPYQGAFNHASSFHLRAASWDQVHDDPNKRRPDNGAVTARPYHQPHMDPLFFGEHASRAPRPRPGDPNNFGLDGAVWAPSHEIVNIAYGAPVIPAMYSDERTGAFFLLSFAYAC